MTTTNKYVIVSKQEVDFKNYSGLTRKEIEELIDNREIFIKYLNMVQSECKITLATGSARGQEESIYNIVDGLEKIISDLNKLNINEMIKKFDNNIKKD